MDGGTWIQRFGHIDLYFQQEADGRRYRRPIYTERPYKGYTAKPIYVGVSHKEHEGKPLRISRYDDRLMLTYTAEPVVKGGKAVRFVVTENLTLDIRPDHVMARYN